MQFDPNIPVMLQYGPWPASENEGRITGQVFPALPRKFDPAVGIVSSPGLTGTRRPESDRIAATRWEAETEADGSILRVGSVRLNP